MMSSDFGARPPVRLDEFEFSDEIEAELAHMEAQQAAAGGGTADTADGMHEDDDNVGVSGMDASSSRFHTSMDDRREAIRQSNPAAAHAYAESHFSRPQPAAVPAAILTHQRMSSNPLSAAAAAASSFLPAAFLSPSSSTPNSAASLATPYGTPATPAPAAVGFAALSGSSSSSSGGVGVSSEHSEFYDDDANYFNLGGSSFPLLPHSSLYEAEMTDTPGSIGGIGPEKAFTPSGRVHAQHFTSILNQPTSFLRDNATRAVSVSTAYLPSLASLWTFTLGVEPPQAVKAASEDIASFAEEGAADPGPFVLKPIPGLDERDLDMSLVVSYMQQLKDKMASYRRNHPDSTIAYKTGEATRMLKEKTKGHYAKSAAGMSPAVYRTTLEDELLQLDAQLQIKSHSDDHADDVESLLALDKDLHECYRLIPPIYFEPNCQLGNQEFWQDTNQLDYLKTSSQTLKDTYNSLYMNDKQQQQQQSNFNNPYASFKSLTSYHHSPFFRLPSLEEQTRVAKLAHRIAESRNAFMHDFNENAVTNFQNILSTYLDRVENNLLQQISLKSWIFFDALKNINAISTEINECLSSIHTIRDSIKELQNSLTNAGLGVLAQKRSIGHTLKLIHLLELMASVSKTSPTVQLLLSTGDFSNALNLIHQTRVLLNGELKDVKALKSIHVKLNQHEILIQQMMQMEFVGLSIRGGNFYFVNDSATTTTNKDGTIDVTHAGKLKKSFIAMNRVLAEDEEDRLVPLVSHLLELNSFSTVFESYTNQLQSILKQRLMDLVYELLNRVQDEKELNSGEEEATSTPPESAASASGTEPNTSDEEVEEEDELKVSEKDKDAAISLLSDTAATGTEGEKDSVIPAVTMTSTSASPDSTLAPAPAAVPTEPSPASSTSANPAAAPSATVAADAHTASLGGHKYGERKQAAIAMPVNATNNVAYSSPAPPPSTAAPAAQSSVSPPVPSPSPAAAQSASVTSRFSSLQHDQFLALLKPMFQSLMDLIVRASSIRNLAVACVQSNSSFSSESKESLLSHLNEQLVKLLEYVHEKIGKILQTRAGVHASLSLAEFREYLDTILQFLQEGERITSRTFYGLRAKLLSQAKSFLVVFHAKMMQKLSSSLELEKWTRVDVPNEFQVLLDSHFQSPKQQDKASTAATAEKPAAEKAAATASIANGTGTPTVDPFADPSQSSTPNASSSTSSSKAPLPTWQSKSWSEVDESDAANKQQQSTSEVSSSTAPTQNPALKSADSTGAAAKTAPSDLRRVLFVPRVSTLKGVPSLASGANIGFMKFPVVQSLLVLLEIVGEYIECSSQLQAVGSDILNRLVELLQMFNSRSCQLVLGAGAMHLSGLKSITATHLALASQSVGFIVTQVPVLRQILSQRLPAKHHVLLVSLDRVSKDCQEHQKEIFAKLVSIMSELIRGMVSQLDTMPWTKLHVTGEGAAANPTVSAGEEVDECVKTLMKQTCSLHRALSDLLLPEQRDLIFRDISQLFFTSITDFLNKFPASVLTNSSTQRPSLVKIKIAYNVNHIITRLRTCTGIDESYLQQLSVHVL